MGGIDRRDFLRLAGMAGVAAALATSGCAVTAAPAAAPTATSTSLPEQSSIRYPRPLRGGDAIGITAPSAGVGPELEPRLEFCVDSLRRLGYEPRLGDCLLSDRVVSAPA